MSKKKYKYQTLAQFARTAGVSRNTALHWATSNPPRVKAFNPAMGVWLIEIGTKRPSKLKPWETGRKYILELQT